MLSTNNLGMSCCNILFLFCYQWEIDKKHIDKYNRDHSKSICIGDDFVVSARKSPDAPKWEQLSVKLLSNKGKALVSEDPNLNELTLAALKETEEELVERAGGCTHRFYLDANEDGSNISATLIASCINDNVYACMAELVARYAELRRMTFYETACKLCQLRDAGSLYRLSPEMPHTPIQWFPTLGMPVRKTLRLQGERPKSSRTKSSSSSLIHIPA